MDIAREEGPDSGMNSEGVPKTGRGNDGRWKARKTKNRFSLPIPTARGNRKRRDFHVPTVATTTLSFPHSSRKKRALHTFPPRQA